jgi:hypothetical protein
VTRYSKTPVRPKPFEPFDFRRMYADADAGPPLRRLRDGATLTQLVGDYELFTIAPLVMRGGLAVNPIREWMNENGHESGVWLVPLSEPVVNLGNDRLSKIWASKLWACEKPLWEQLSFRLGTIAMINRATRTFVRSLCQEIPVADVVALSKVSVLPAECPMVKITTFSLDGNKGILAFEPAAAPPLDQARLVSMPAESATVALALALFGEAGGPYDAAAQLLKEAEQNAPDNPRTPTL